MRGRRDFKSKIISSQKPLKRSTRAGRDRNKVDLIKLHKNLVEAKVQTRPARSKRIKGAFFALMAILCFFLFGCLIAALSAPTWAKVLLFTLIAVLALIPSYILATLLH